MQTALVDGDILVYRVGFASNDVSEGYAIARMAEFLEDLIFLNGFDKYKGYLTGGGNYRNEIAKTAPYKGNRKADKPIHYKALRDYMMKAWAFELIEGRNSIFRVECNDQTVFDRATEQRFPLYHEIQLRIFRMFLKAENLRDDTRDKWNRILAGKGLDWDQILRH